MNETRPKISIYIATNIDGYIARKDGNLDWLQYGHMERAPWKNRGGMLLK
jgi:dihydrofolate reductase